MPERHATEEELILHYYGEPLDSRPLARGGALEAHIGACPQCQRALEEIGAVLALVDTEAVPEPLAGLDERVWARVQPEMATTHASWWRRFVGQSPRWALAGGIAVLVIAAFVAGRFTRPERVAPSTDSVADSSTVSADRLMSVAVGDHLDESQMVLMELLNGDPSEPSDIEGQQLRARDLVAANRLYRQTAVSRGDEGVGDVLDVLERVLLEIANAPPDVSARELEALKTDIEQRGILFRLRVMSAEMRAREQHNVTAPPPQAGP